MASGPSKEELENYFKNSRQYFDELARHYFETDRAYYDEYIAPFYSNFRVVASGRSSAAARVIVLFALFALIAGAGVISFLIMNQRGNEVEKKIERIEKEQTIKQTDSLSNLSDYERGIKYFNSKDYDSAEKYFKKVQKKDKNYSDSQKKLEEIKTMEQKNNDKEDAVDKKKPPDNNGRTVKPTPKKRSN